MMGNSELRDTTCPTCGELGRFVRLDDSWRPAQHEGERGRGRFLRLRCLVCVAEHESFFEFQPDAMRGTDG
jgi:ribosomal protein S27E